MDKVNNRYYSELIPATEKYKNVIKNLARFYVYELSRFNDTHPDTRFPEDGLYEAYEAYFKFDQYWTKPEYYPFIIRVNDELAGFVLINKNGSTPNIDWYLAEFFIIAKFQRKKIGKDIAHQLFKEFKGTWEIMQLSKNLPAIKFWRKVISDYTKGKFDENLKAIRDAKEHTDMIVQTFST